MIKIKSWILIMVSLTILVAACDPSQGSPQSPADESDSAVSAAPRYEPLEQCFVDIPDGIDYDCGHVIVPEFHGVDNGRTITLSVLRFPSPAETPADPLFLGVGGPGEDGIGRGVITAARLLNSDSFASQLLATRDLVYFSQRGTIYSEPELTCPVHDEYAARVGVGNVSAQDLRQFVSEALLDCYEDFVAAGVDFTAFNSLENAADVDSIREVLGYDQIVYYGESYGTLLGQHLLRDFPEALSAVILDGVVSIDAVVYEEKIDERFDYALGQLLDLCAADAACHDAVPTLADDIEAVYQQLQDEPYELVTSSGAIFPIDGPAFATALFGSLYSPTLSADVPFVIDAILNPSEDTQGHPAVSRFFGSILPGDRNARLMHFAVTCAEDPIDSLDDAKSLDSPELSVYTAFAEADASDYVRMCSVMDLPVLPDETDEIVTSDIPVLVLNGGMDPATPPYFAAQLTDALPNSYSFLFPYGSHVQGMNDSCSQSIAFQFMEDPLTEPDGSCIEETEPPVFNLPGE